MSEEPTPEAQASETQAPETDRRAQPSDRRQGDRRQKDVPVAVDRRKGERRKAQRRKRRGPNQYELDEAELEFINAINAFKAETGRPFPTWSEVLRIVRKLGYEKTS